MHKVTNHAINFYILGTDLKVLRKKKKSSTKTNFLQNKLFWKVKSHTKEKKSRVCGIWRSYFLRPGSYQKMQHEVRGVSWMDKEKQAFSNMKEGKKWDAWVFCFPHSIIRLLDHIRIYFFLILFNKISINQK